MTSIRVERRYPHRRDKVWRALTDRDLLARWLMPNDFAPRVGHDFTFRTDPGPGFDGVIHCRVTELVPQERLALTWKGGPIDTVVTFSLHDDDGGTRLIVEQTGFRGLKAWLVSRILKIGSRTLYGKRLPALLDSLDSRDGDSTANHPNACMTRGQGLIRRLLVWMERRPR